MGYWRGRECHIFCQPTRCMLVQQGLLRRCNHRRFHFRHLCSDARLAAAPSGSSADAATRPAMMLMLRMLRLRVLSVCHQLLFVHRKRLATLARLLATQPTHTLTTSTTTTLQFQPLVATTLPQLVAVSTHMAMTTATQAGTSKPVHADGRRSCRSSAGMVFSCGSKCLRFYDTLIPLNRRISFQQRTCKE